MNPRSETFDRVCKQVADKHCVPLKVVHDIVELQFKTLSDITKKCIPISFYMPKVGTFLCNEELMMENINAAQGNIIVKKSDKIVEDKKQLKEKIDRMMTDYNVNEEK